MKKFDGVVKYFESRGDNFAFCISPGLLEFELGKECFSSLPENKLFSANSFIGRKTIIWCDENSNIYEVEIEEINVDFKFYQPWIVYRPASKAQIKKRLMPMELNWKNKLRKQVRDKLIDLYILNTHICRTRFGNDELSLRDNLALEVEMFFWAKYCGNKSVEMILSDLVELAPSLFSSLAYQIKGVSKSEIIESARNNRCSFEEDSRVPDLYNMFNIVERAFRFPKRD